MPDIVLSTAYPAGEEVGQMQTETVYKCPVQGCDYVSDCKGCAASHCYDIFWYGEQA